MPTSPLHKTAAHAASGRALLTVPREDCLRLREALAREWLLADGLGGFASSTVLFCPTRRYHGLLVAPVSSGPGRGKRHLFLARYEEHVAHGDASFPLSIARYRGVFSPQGHRALERFELVPFPSSLYKLGGAEIRREVLVPGGQHAVLVRWSITGASEDVALRLRPLVAFREADSLTTENSVLDARAEDLQRGGLACGFRIRPYPSLPPLVFSWAGAAGRFEHEPYWYRGLEYEEEIARGYPGHEDQWSPGELSFALGQEREVVVAAALGEPVADPLALWREESRRRVLLAAAVGFLDDGRESVEPGKRRDERRASSRTHDGARAPESHASAERNEPPRELDPRSALDLTADDFLYRAADGRPGIVAGFPWFGEWGRDTYISLPGLLLARGRLELAGEVLAAALPFLRRGLLPNVFGSEPETSRYNSADASLWYALAVRRYESAGAGDEEMLERFLPALAEIAGSYRDGTDLDIACDEGGLPRLGSPAMNPTWMDAVTSSGPVTPRHGFPVETSALWCSLLEHLEELCAKRGDERAAKEWKRARKLAGRTFVERFWIEDKRYLADVWRDGQRDVSVRPNMVIAAALELSPLSRGQRTDVVQRAEVELLTPRGLRTLAPRGAGYIGRYGGDPEQRDAAYHQGTVWPWLLGYFAEAWLRAIGSKKRDVERLRTLLDGLAPHLAEAGLMHVSEVFDGDPPHAPGGSIAQAWSTAEILRAYALVDEAAHERAGRQDD